MFGVSPFLMLIVYNVSFPLNLIFILSFSLIWFISSCFNWCTSPVPSFQVAPESKLYFQSKVLYSSNKAIFPPFSPSNEYVPTISTAVFSYKLNIAATIKLLLADAACVFLPTILIYLALVGSKSTLLIETSFVFAYLQSVPGTTSVQFSPSILVKIWALSILPLPPASGKYSNEVKFLGSSNWITINLFLSLPSHAECQFVFGLASIAFLACLPWAVASDETALIDKWDTGIYFLVSGWLSSVKL